MSKLKYTDIGHGDPNDVIWIIIDDEMFMMPAGLGRTHELIWGGDTNIENHWRGRYDIRTGRCSITPPGKQLGRRRPPEIITSELRQRFSVVRFFYFADGQDSFSPNPKKVRRR